MLRCVDFIMIGAFLAVIGIGLWAAALREPIVVEEEKDEDEDESSMAIG